MCCAASGCPSPTWCALTSPCAPQSTASCTSRRAARCPPATATATSSTSSTSSPPAWPPLTLGSAAMSDAASIERLRAPFGVEARGLDLAAPDCTREEFDALRRAFDDHHLLLLRGPVISGEAQISFVARFGPLIAERGLWGYVSNVREDGIVREGPLLFHSDFAFTQSPVWAISLHAW